MEKFFQVLSALQEAHIAPIIPVALRAWHRWVVVFAILRVFVFLATTMATLLGTSVMEVATTNSFGLKAASIRMFVLLNLEEESNKLGNNFQ